MILGRSGSVLADSIFFRVTVYFLGAVALLLQCIVLLGCVPPLAGSGSALSTVYLVEFNSATQNQTTRLRVGYTAMCASISGAPEHCAITVGKSQESSVESLSLGGDTSGFDNTPDNKKLSSGLFHVAQSLQEKVFLVLPAVPAVFLTLGILGLAAHGTSNKPFVGFASSAKQYDRNRTLDIIRVIMLALIGLTVVFSFAIAVGASQMYSALQSVTGPNNDGTNPDGDGDGDDDPNSAVKAGGSAFHVSRGSGALALHWLSVVIALLFFVGVIFSVVQLSMVSFAVTPPDTAGSGAQTYSSGGAPGGTMERASLLHGAAPVAQSPPPSGVTPNAAPPNGGGMGGAMGMRGGAMGMRGGARGGAMGMRGGAGGMRGGPMRGR